MPEKEMILSQKASLSCDLFIAIGSSLQVYPAAGFPILAKKNGSKLVILNREKTDLDGYADLVIHDEIGSFLSKSLNFTNWSLLLYQNQLLHPLISSLSYSYIFFQE